MKGVSQVVQERLDHRAQQDHQAHVVREDNVENLVHREKVEDQANLGQLDPVESVDRMASLVHQVRLVKEEVLAQLDQQGQLDQQDHKVNVELEEKQVNQVNGAHQATQDNKVSNSVNVYEVRDLCL